MDTEGNLQSHHKRWVQFDLFCNLGLRLGFSISLAYWVPWKSQIDEIWKHIMPKEVLKML